MIGKLNKINAEGRNFTTGHQNKNKGMSKNIMNLYEVVDCFVRCDYCKRELHGVDCFEVAEEADYNGWKVNRSGKVKCQHCQKNK